jgi:hypothetical protein
VTDARVQSCRNAVTRETFLSSSVFPGKGDVSNQGSLRDSAQIADTSMCRSGVPPSGGPVLMLVHGATIAVEVQQLGKEQEQTAKSALR